jgi:hypothetical protein
MVQHTFLNRIGWLSLLLCMASASPLFAEQAEPEIQVWVENPMVRVHPDTPPKAASSIEIAAARNEVEPFQVVIYSRTRKLDGVTAAIADFVSAEGKRISRSGVTLYREQYHYLRHPSPNSSDTSDLWPDALVPFVDPVEGLPLPEMQLVHQEQEGEVARKLIGARFSGSPFAISPGKSQPIWVDVSIPKDAAAGVYTSIFTVTIPGFDPVTLPIQLTVWDFTLPDGAPLSTHFGSLAPLAAKHHVQPGTPEYKQLYEQYAGSLAAHRIAPPIPEYLYPPIKPDGSIDWQKSVEGLKAFIERYQIHTFQIPTFPLPDPLNANRKACLRYLQSYYDFLKAQGWEKGAYYFPIDEPNSKKEYDRVRAYAQLVHEASPSIKFLCTEQPYPQDDTWGSLDEAVDIWCSLFGFYDESSGRQALQQGKQLWSYTALCQTAPPYHPGYASLVGRPVPFWEIDFPAINFRIPLWMNWHYGISGLLYWSTVYWDSPERDVWTDPAFRNRYNGEGFLFYPGVDAGFQGPVASIRLKVLREGMEDYLYFALLASLGGKDFADSEVAKVAPSWWKWSDDPQQLYQVRTALAEKIVELRHRQQ